MHRLPNIRSLVVVVRAVADMAEASGREVVKRACLFVINTTPPAHDSPAAMNQTLTQRKRHLLEDLRSLLQLAAKTRQGEWQKATRSPQLFPGNDPWRRNVQLPGGNIGEKLQVLSSSRLSSRSPIIDCVLCLRDILTINIV